MKINERESYWRQVVGQQKKSGLSVMAFCRQESLCAHRLYFWRRRLGKSQPIGFAVVKVIPPPAASLELILISGERLQISAGVEATTLRTVLAALWERA